MSLLLTALQPLNSEKLLILSFGHVSDKAILKFGKPSRKC